MSETITTDGCYQQPMVASVGITETVKDSNHQEQPLPPPTPEFIPNTGIRQRIYDYLQIAYFPLNPALIALNLNLNRNSVKPELRKLLKMGVIKQDAHGDYCSLTSNHATHGMPVVAVLPRDMTHNIVMCFAYDGKFYESIVFGYLDLSVSICFGVKRNRVTVTLACESNVDVYTWWCVCALCFDKLSVLGVSPPPVGDWDVVSAELNSEGEEYTLDRESLCVRDVDGLLTKWYNSSPRVGKVERRVATRARPVKAGVALAILGDKVAAMQLSGRVGTMEDELKRNTYAQKELNGDIAAILRENADIRSNINDIKSLLKGLSAGGVVSG